MYTYKHSATLVCTPSSDDINVYAVNKTVEFFFPEEQMSKSWEDVSPFITEACITIAYDKATSINEICYWIVMAHYQYKREWTSLNFNHWYRKMKCLSNELEQGKIIFDLIKEEMGLKRA